MSKFKVGDRVRTTTVKFTNWELGSIHEVTDIYPCGAYELDESEAWSEDELELIPEVYLCDTCANANVDCPIYPPKTCPTCVEYVERKANPFAESDKAVKEAFYACFAKPLFESKSDKEVINEMLTESVSSGETKEVTVGFPQNVVNNLFNLVGQTQKTKVTSGLPNEEQILPTQGNQNVPLELIRFILQRDKKGQETYGSSLMSNNGRDALRDALEEALDLCQYLMQMYLERESKNE